MRKRGGLGRPREAPAGCSATLEYSVLTIALLCLQGKLEQATYDKIKAVTGDPHHCIGVEVGGAGGRAGQAVRDIGGRAGGRGGQCGQGGRAGYWARRVGRRAG